MVRWRPVHFEPKDDGKVIDGKVVVYLRPLRGPDYDDGSPDPHGKAGGDARAEVKPAASGAPDEAEAAKDAAKPPKPPITNLRWSVDAATHGDQVEMAADVSEGKVVLFTVERRSTGGPWQSIGTVQARVAGGAARASMRLEHSGAIDLEHCRFRARLL